MNLEKMTFSSIEKKLPKLFLFGFLLIGLFIVVFVYFLFNRGAQEKIMASSQKELGTYTIQINEQQMKGIFIFEPRQIDFNNEEITPKNPFTYIK